MAGKVIDVEAFVDNQKLRAFHYGVLVWSFLLMVLDGYDIQALSVSAPLIIRAWHLDPATIGPMLSASNFGVLFGAPLFGWVGDRFGRRPALLASGALFGVFTLATVLAGSVSEMAMLRFVAGIGIAGVLGNTIALNAEVSPTRVRATMIIVMFTGNTLGGAIPGLIGPWAIGLGGWPAMFYIGGIGPLLLVALLFFVLPESIKFLAVDPARQARTVRVARQMQPELRIAPGDQFAYVRADAALKGTFADLFRGRFAIITPLLWLLFTINLMVLYFSSFWLPTLVGPAIVKLGGSANQAGLALAMYQIGGTLGGLVLSRFIDRLGIRPVIACFVVAIPFIIGIGYAATVSPGLLQPMAFMAGFGILGAQFGLNASAGIIYPTHIRANGVGWAFGVGRFGAVLGPIVGGWLLAEHVGIQQMYIIAATPFVLSIVLAVVLIGVLQRGRGLAGQARPATV